MGILDGPTGALGGAPANSGGSCAAVATRVIAMLANRPGGLSGILQAFQQGGLSHLIQSWIGTGQNLPVSPDQLKVALGPEWIARIAQSTGLPQAEVEQHLSTVLPQIIDHLTPNGRLPQGDLGSALAGIAQRFLRG
jgi:uncharacterized protein YidB (DUF937 family)